MNKIKFLSLSLVALLMVCFTACENKYDVDHTAHIVGTWTYIGPNYAEALVIKEDGSVLSTGVEDGEYWENVAGTIKIKDNVATMTFEDGDDAIGHIDVVPGIAFSIYEEDGEAWTFNYCAEDLSEEVVGMWVCNDGPNEEKNDMNIHTYNEDGTVVLTGFAPDGSGFHNQGENTYTVVGNLMFTKVSALAELGINSYVSMSLKYAQNGTSLGDALYTEAYLPMNANGDVAGVTQTFLRIKESLNFTGQTYDYSAAYVSNAKGKNEDFTILGHTFNIANITGGNFDMFFRSELYNVEVSATSIKQKFHPNGEDVEIDVPITVDGNKVTLDFSAVTPALRKVDMYMFLSASDSQLHVYMPTASAVNYLANLEFITLLKEGKITPADTAAVEKIFTDMAARIESINVSWVFKARN